MIVIHIPKNCINCEHLQNDGSCRWCSYLPRDHVCERFEPRRDFNND